MLNGTSVYEHYPKELRLGAMGVLNFRLFKDSGLATIS
jgi:hypothetical protein